MRRSWIRTTSVLGLPVLTAVAGLLLALTVTPPVGVTVFGQALRLGTVPPAALGGFSGPGQADLFGEGPIDTVLKFSGPVRPRIVWERFDRDPAATAFVETSPQSGPSLRTGELGDALVAGWTAYLVRLVALAAAISGGLCLAVLGAVAVVRGQHGRHQPRRVTLAQVGAAVLLGAVVTAGSAALTVATAREELGTVTSLSDITGTAPLVPAPAPVGPHPGDARLAVIGDSTAAGVGNAPVTAPTELDTACGRSQDAYGVVLGSAMRTSAANLACSSATVDVGLLGVQSEGGRRMPAQVGVLKSMPALRVVVVSVGANDIGWSDFLRLCYGLARCDDQVSERLFQSRLDAFRIQYALLLQQLSSLPTHPQVVVALYYDPFGDRFDCPALQDPAGPAQPPPGYGFAGEKDGVDQGTKLRQKVDPMRSELAQLNQVLADGAQAFGFTSVAPSFEGHALCSAQPWVQGLSQPFPFHPNAAGELAIAAAVIPEVVGAVGGPG